MRLICPTCGAAYEVSDGMIPAVGRHVQCVSCNTRWFVQTAHRDPPSEDQVLARLEARPVRLRPVIVPMLPLPAGRSSGPEAIDLTRDEPEAEAVKLNPPPPPRREPVTLPAVEPIVTRPSPLVERPAPVHAARLELDPPATKPPVQAPRSRFARGMLLVLVPAAMAFGAYRFHDALVAQIPAAALALDDYEMFVDRLREDVQAHIETLRGDRTLPSEQVK